MRNVLAVIGFLFLVACTITSFTMVKDLVKAEKTIAALQVRCGIDPALTQDAQKVEAQKVGQ